SPPYEPRVTGGSMSGALLRLAQVHGIAPSYADVWGKEHRVPEHTLRTLLSAMGVSAESDAAAKRSLAAHEAQRSRRVLPPVAMARLGCVAAVRLRLPRRLDAASVDWTLSEESGARHA